MSNFSKYLILFLILFSGIACSTKKNTAITRSYHNLTSRYNILFNGSESFKSGINKLIQNYDDDYTSLLPVFLYTDKNALTGISAEMDRSIKKATKLIAMHSLTVKPEMKADKQLTPKQKEFYNKKEYNIFVDDTYLLMGKAHFYRMEYTEAKETFNYIILNFPGSKNLFETNLWLARLANEEKKYKESEEILNSLIKNIEFPKRLRGELFATQTDFYVKQQMYKEAIDPLQKTIKYTNHKFLRTRYTYILAQIYNLTGDYVKSSEYFDKVTRMNPPYKMTFNAKINRALTYQAGTGSRKDIEKQLLKMLKDDKNIEYQDQIYYALGNIYFTDNIMEKAVEYYTLSIQKSKQNNRQKAQTSIRLAEIYYDRPDYIMAEAYYDTALLVIDENYPDYKKIQTKSGSLSKLVDNIRIYEFEDSVIKLSYKPRAEILALITELIDKEVKAEQEREYQAKLLAEENLSNQTEQQLQRMDQRTTNWYFYNPVTKNAGEKEFMQRWGNRRLEDNWRRKNKSVVSFDELYAQGDEQGDNDELPKGTIVTNKKKPEYYLQYIPFSDSAKQVSEEKIASALLVIGETYGFELKDHQKSIQAYEDFLKRFRNDENRLQVYYKLYNLAKATQDIDRVALYQRKIVDEYPASNFAKLMTNPNYLDEIKAQEQRILDEYNTLYSLFNARNFTQSEQIARKSMYSYPDHELYPKFDYIYTVSSGIRKDTLDFISDLQALAKRYPSTDISNNVQIMISYLQNKSPQVVTRQNERIAKTLYSFDPAEEHYFAFRTPASINTNQLIFNMVNFNLDNFDKLRLEVKKVSVDAKTSLCLAQKFTNSTLAMEYLSGIRQDRDIFKDISPAGIVPMIISKTNYTRLIESGNVDQYLLFFNENYK